MNLHYWPWVTCVWFVLAFMISYWTAITNKHVYPFFPYISDTGSIPPESCTFGIMLNIGALLYAVTIYIRHCQVNLAIQSGSTTMSKKWVYLSLWSGSFVALGLLVVANYQESAWFMVHIIGALIMCHSCLLYFIIQTKISIFLMETNNNKIGTSTYYIIVASRIILTCIYAVLLLLFTIPGIISHAKFTGTNKLWWTYESGGYVFHLISTISEWFLSIIMGTFVLTFTYEFKLIEFKKFTWINKYSESIEVV